MYNAHLRFWPKLSGEKLFCFNFFNSIFNLFIFRYLFFCILKELEHFFLNMIWYKKFYVTDNYKTQEQIHDISGITHV